MLSHRNNLHCDVHDGSAPPLRKAILVGELLLADALLASTILFLIFLMLPAPLADALPAPGAIWRAASQALAGWLPQ